MKKLIRIISLAFAGLFLFPSMSFAGSYKTTETEITTSFYNYSFVLEYQNNLFYRVINDEKAEAKIFDYNINYQTGEVILNEKYVMTEKLPSSVIKARENGATIIAEFVPANVPSCASKEGFSYELDDYARITFKMKFHPKVCKNVSISDYVSKMDKKIPLIDYKYGRNLYYLSFLGQLKVAYGYYDESRPNFVNEPLVHPSIIKNNSGAFKIASVINFYGEEQSCVGSNIRVDNDKNSFKNGNAVKLEFYCPFYVKYIARYTSYIKDPSDDKPVVPPKPIDPIPIIDPKSFNLKIHRLR